MRKREARPSPEPLPPGEGRGGTAAMGKSNGQGGGAARSATREDTAPQDVQHFHVAVGDQRSPNGQAHSAWPNKNRGRLACPNPPCVSIAAPARVSDAKQNRLLRQITDPNRLEKRKTAVCAWRSERPKRADFVEKHLFAGAEYRRQSMARAPFLSGVSRVLRCREDLGQFAEVLGGCGEEEFVICPTWSA